MLQNKFRYYCLLALMMVLNFSCDSNKQRVIKYYYDDGGIESEVEFIGNKMNGIAKYYYPNGALHLVAPHVDDKIHGEVYEYFEDGGLKAVKNFKDDELNGWVMEYDEGKVLRNRTEYGKGKIVFNVSFYRSGDTSAIHENGRTFIFFETGKVKQVLCANDTEVFSSVRFSADGAISKRVGSLECLSKEDSLLLERQYPGWKVKNVE